MAIVLVRRTFIHVEDPCESDNEMGGMLMARRNTDPICGRPSFAAAMADRTPAKVQSSSELSTASCSGASADAVGAPPTDDDDEDRGRGGAAVRFAGPPPRAATVADLRGMPSAEVAEQTTRQPSKRRTAPPQARVTPGAQIGEEPAAGRKRGQKQKPCLEDRRTTLTLRNLPRGYTTDMLLRLLGDMSLAEPCDFLYIPHSIQTHCSLGFAFVNFATPADAQRAFGAFDGFQAWGLAGERPCVAAWSPAEQQGLAALVARYRNSTVFAAQTPTQCRPMVLHGGRPAAFPAPTRRGVRRAQRRWATGASDRRG